MSHFTVLVIGDNPEEQLSPFNEQPPEGSEYLEFNDCTEEVKEAWENKMIPCVKIRADENNPQGRWVCEYSSAGRNAKIGSKMDKPAHEVYKDINQFAEDWFGYHLSGASWGYWHNPNAKWDWYSLGGRWKGNFLLKPGAEGITGESGVFDNEARPGYVDRCRRGDIDVLTMRMQAKARANAEYDRFEAAVEGLEEHAVHWDGLRDSFTRNLSHTEDGYREKIDEARAEYRNNPWVQAIEAAGFKSFMGPCYYDMFYVNQGGRERYVQVAMNECITTFAVLMDGEWYERGNMGWWGIVTDEADEDVWHEQYSNLFNNLPDDIIVSVYDCHI